MFLARAFAANARRGIGARALSSCGTPAAFRSSHFSQWSSSRIRVSAAQINSELKNAVLGSFRQRHFGGSHFVQQSKSGAKSDGSNSKGGFVGWYLNHLDKRPVVTKSLTACTIYTTADLVSQRLTAMKLGTDAPWDHVRTIRMSLVGLCMSGPTLHLWFNFLNKILPGRDMISTLKKMFLGQTTYGPAFTATFFSINALAQGESGAEIWQRLKRDLIPTLASGLMYWPFCDLITFRYVPVHLQPLVSNSFSLVWTVYLTYMASLKK